MNECIIGIGSNMNAQANIKKVLKLLDTHFLIMQISTMVQTKAIGMTDQPDYTNGAVRILTEMSMDELLFVLKKLEDQMGRDRTQPKYGPRNIDLDLLIWNNEVVDADYYTREFLRESAKELGYKSKDT